MTEKIEKIKNHLEFLGYTIEESKPEKEGEKLVYLGTHPTKYNLIFTDFTPGIVMFRCQLATGKMFSEERMLFLNNANKTIGITKVYADENDKNMVLKFEAFYGGDYIKASFSEFIGAFEGDTGPGFRAVENFSKLFLD